MTYVRSDPKLKLDFLCFYAYYNEGWKNMTLEELQNEVLTLKDQIKTVEVERDTLKGSVEESTRRITELQEHNQKLFLKLTQPEDNNDESQKPDIIEFAKTLKF